MFLFTPTKSIEVVSTVARLRSKSSNAIAVFKSTVSNLTSVNNEIDAELDEVEERLRKLKNTKLELNAVAKENEGFINKINEFLGVTE
jgi:cell shape-determining protein MreC